MIWLPRTTDNSTYFAQSLEIRGIESRLYFTFQIANNKGAKQTAWMRRLVCIFVVRMQQSQGSHINALMMLKPMLPGLRLVLRLLSY